LLAAFMEGGSCCMASIPTADGRRQHYQRGFTAMNGDTLQLSTDRPTYDRGNAYVLPDAYERATSRGILESADCAPAGGAQADPSAPGDDRPPCFVAPASTYDGKRFPYPRSEIGRASC